MKTYRDEVIIVLQDDRAAWYRWQGAQIVDQKIIPLVNKAEEGIVIPFEGLVNRVDRFNYPRINLIIDSSLDEFTPPIGEFGKEKSRAIKERDKRICESLNAACQEWILAVQEKGLVFDKVLSSLSLLDRTYGKGRQRVLIIVDDDRLGRHVLCTKKGISYARQCTYKDVHNSQEALSETLHYLSDLKAPYSLADSLIVYVGDDPDTATSLNKLSNKPVSFQPVSNAADWYCDLFRRKRPRGTSQWLNKKLSRHLSKSEARRRHRRNDQQLYLATCLTVFVASVTVIVACIHGFTVAKYMRSVEAKTTNMMSEHMLTTKAAAKVHSEPVQTADSLARLDLFNQIYYLNAAGVLTLIGDAVTQHPEIELDRIEWLLTDNREATQWVSVPSLDNAPVPVSINKVLDQSPHNAEATRIKTGTQIVIEGSVKDSTLRERQAVFEEFVATLSSLSDIDSVQIVSSPLDNASSSERSDADQLFSLQVFHWPS